MATPMTPDRKPRSRQRVRLAAAAVTAVAALVAGCTGGSSDTGQQAATGSITVATWSATASLDPAQAGGTGIAGGAEIAALYDTIMRYDSEKQSYVPETAESLSHNDDFTVWTLKLRSGIKFTDGTDYNAAAVVSSMKRLVELKARTASLIAPVSSFATPDDLTVVFTLKSPWNGFPFALASAPGMIVSPAAIKTLGDKLGAGPVGAGAGPFKLNSFKPGESLVLDRNPDYWGNPPKLDKITFVNPGSDAQEYEAFKAGQVQVAILRSSAVIADAKSDGFGGILVPYSASDTLMMNDGLGVTCLNGQPAARCTGQKDGTVLASTSPTADVRVRQAVAHAIDPHTLNLRVWDGKANVSTDLITKGSRWYNGVAGPAYDIEKAKSLVAEVKADGKWDGSIRLSCHTALPTFGPTVQGMLEAAGFKVALTDKQDITANTTAVTARRDFDLACFGSSIADPEPFNALNRDFNSAYLTTGGGDFSGYANDAVDAAIAAGRAAKTDAEEKAAITTIAEAYTRDVPFLALASNPEQILIAKSLSGVRVSTNSVPLFQGAQFK